MTVVEKHPVPIYEVVCEECKSKIQYKACEVAFCHITCPVCGKSVWANTVCPVRYESMEWLEQCDKELANYIRRCKNETVL